MAANTPNAKIQRCGLCACFNLRKAARAVTQLYDRAFQPLGLRATQFQILAAIGSRQPIHIGDLAAILVMDRTTLSRDLGPLDKRGWVNVEPGKDRRTRAVVLTPKGRKLVEAAYPAWEKTQKKVVDRLGKDGFDALLEELKSTVSVARGTEEAA